MKKLTCFLSIVLLFIMTACGAQSGGIEVCDCKDSNVAESEVIEVSDYKDSNVTEITDDSTSTLSSNNVHQNSSTSSNQTTDSSTKQAIDEDGNFTEEALDAARVYLRKLNNGQVEGRFTTDIYGFDLRLSSNYTAIVNGVDTGLRTDKKILYDEIVDFYMSGEWDGKETDFKDHVISLAEGKGYLRCDGYLLCGQKNLDLPEQYWDIEGTESDYTYIPGEGTYVIIDHRLVKYVRGNEVSLPGDELSWKGTYYGEDVRLVYSHYGRRLYVLTCNPEYERTIDDELAFNMYNDELLVYVFPDYNKSEMKYLGIITYGDLYEGADVVNFESLTAKNK